MHTLSQNFLWKIFSNSFKEIFQRSFENPHTFFGKKSSKDLPKKFRKFGPWLLMFASIGGQNNASLSGAKEGRHSDHTGTYFFPLFEFCTFVMYITLWSVIGWQCYFRSVFASFSRCLCCIFCMLFLGLLKSVVLSRIVSVLAALWRGTFAPFYMINH